MTFAPLRVTCAFFLLTVAVTCFTVTPGRLRSVMQARALRTQVAAGRSNSAPAVTVAPGCSSSESSGVGATGATGVVGVVGVCGVGVAVGTGSSPLPVASASQVKPSESRAPW